MIDYNICIEGHLDPRWQSHFSGFAISHHFSAGGQPYTLLSGPVGDQAALYGILSRLRDLGAALISVQPGQGTPPGGDHR